MVVFIKAIKNVVLLTCNDPSYAKKASAKCCTCVNGNVISSYHGMSVLEKEKFIILFFHVHLNERETRPRT
jgi:hypothetical protein